MLFNSLFILTILILGIETVIQSYRHGLLGLASMQFLVGILVFVTIAFTNPEGVLALVGGLVIVFAINLSFLPFALTAMWIARRKKAKTPTTPTDAA